jgi:ComF family protein
MRPTRLAPSGSALLRAAWRGASLAAQALEDWAVPHCAVCGLRRIGGRATVCSACLGDFFDASVPRCRVCAARLPDQPVYAQGNPRCGRCLAVSPAFDATLALGDYAAPLDGMVTALKFGARLDLARVFGRLLAARAAAAESVVGRVDAVLAVPLHPVRLRERGFNQSQQIARAVARHWRVPLARQALVRARHRPPQQSLPLAQRRSNVRGAFALRRLPPLRSVAVVDDVMTSGATLDEVARLLKGAAVARVINLVVARTP